MKKPFILLLLLCQLSFGQNSSQILRGFVVPDGAQDYESVAESLGLVIPLNAYTACQDFESYIWTGLKASTVNGLVRNLDSRIRQAPWRIIKADGEARSITYIGTQQGATKIVSIDAITNSLSKHFVLLLLCEVPTN